PQTMQLGNWPQTVGVTFSVDLLSATLILVSSVVGLCGLMATLGFSSKKEELRGLHCFYHFMMTGVLGAFTTSDIFNLYVWFEVLLVASFILVGLSRKKNSWAGDYKYSVLSIVGSFLFLLGIALLYSAAGSLDFATLHRWLSQHSSTLSAQLGGGLLLIAFAVKAGVVPFHFWLPASYPATWGPVVAVFSGLLTKVGIYALIRIFVSSPWMNDSVAWNVLRVLALASMVIGVLGAFSKYNIQSILSFHIISQVGYIVLAFTFSSEAGIVAGLFYLFHHIIVKTNLFFCANYIEAHHGTPDIRKVGGFLRHGPFPAILFAISALSLIGIPPLSGFWAKVFTLQAALNSHDITAFILCLIVSLITLLSMLKVWIEVFWKPQPENSEPPASPASARLLLFPMTLLCVWTLAIGLSAPFIYSLAQRIQEQLQTGGYE
ncbi:MAG: proton-conducting transporter membrane subunit, partial [Bdellovibrio sp.]